MNKKNRNSLIFLLILSIVAIIIYYNFSNNSTVKKELTNFAITDTASVDKIFLANKKNQSILLEKQDNGLWLINKKYVAQHYMVNNLLETMCSIRVKELIPTGGFNNLIKNLAAKSVKVEIYQKNELTKVYYVGEATQDFKGTYMMLENSSMPFIMWIPGFEGYLTTRYSVEEMEWKTKNVFSYRPNQISSIKIEYPRKPNDSFELLISGNNAMLKDIKTGETTTITDRAKVNEYLMNFMDLNYEMVLDAYTDFQKDSIKKAIPMQITTVTNAKGEVNKLVTYPRKLQVAQYDLDGKLYEFDPEKLTGIQNNDKNFVLIQYFAFDKIFKPKSYFTSTK